MKRPRFKHAALTYLTAACAVLALTAQIGSSAVCIGTDGHIDVESGLEACCSPASSDHPAVDGRALYGAESDCGPCIDVLIKAPQHLTKEVSHFGLTVAPYASIAAEPAQKTARTVEAVSSDQRRHSLLPLSSVVLLT
jgi:hypothetical protein